MSTVNDRSLIPVGEERFQTLSENVRRVLNGDVLSTTIVPEVAGDNI